MPTSFCRGPPFSACVPAGSAYSESRHSVPYAEIGIRYDLVVIRKGLLADSAFSVLLNNFPVQQFPHLCRRPKFAISSWVVWIFDALDPKPKSAFFPNVLPTAAEE